MSKRSTRTKRRNQKSKRFSRANDIAPSVSKINFHNIQGANFVNGPTMTSEGFLTVDVVIAKAGPLYYEYRQSDGSVMGRYELLSEEAIFDPEFIESCEGSPFVVDHPQNDSGEFVDVSPDNYEQQIVGILLKPRIDRESRRLLGTLRVFDADVIKKIESGELVEVSQGYTCKILERPGTFEGQAYDVEQIKPSMNHLALVNEGRSGESVRVLYNSKKATLDMIQFVKRRQYTMKHNQAVQKLNEAQAAQAKADEARLALEATEAASKLVANMVGENEPGKQLETLPAAAKDNQGPEMMQQVSQALMKIVEMLQGQEQAPALNSEPPALNSEPPALNSQETDDQKKNPIFNSADITRVVTESINERAKVQLGAVSVLGLEEAQDASRKFNTTDELRRYCLLSTKTKTEDEVSKMNSNQIEAHFDVLVENRKVAINTVDETKINSIGHSESGDEIMTVNRMASY